jgi:hypothetical protein
MDKQKTGSGDRFLDIAAYILALILFAKTADVMGYFSPEWLNGIFGFDVGFLYGIVNATLVEGAALALHFNHRAILSKSAQIVKWVLVGISAVCQILDGYISTGNVAAMTDTLKLTLQVGVPLIPIAVFVMIILIGKLPDDDGAQAKFKGLKNLLPNIGKIWNGDDYAPSATVEFAKDVPQEALAKKSVGKKSANPTKGKV